MRKLIYLLLALCLLTGCSAGGIQENASLFEQFLQGQEKASSSWNGVEGSYSLEDLVNMYEGGGVSYGFLDIDQDLADELHLRIGKDYYVIKEQNQRLSIIFKGESCDIPVNEDGISGILCFRKGEDFRNTSYESYRFYPYTESGPAENPIGFERYDYNSNGSFDQEDGYYWQEQGFGQSCKQEDWLDKALPYIECRSPADNIWTEIAPSLDNWVGTYVYDEFYPRDMFYQAILSIYRDGDEYYADYKADGFQTMIRLKAIVRGNKSRIGVYMWDSDDEAMYSHYSKNELLISLRDNGAGILTRWDRIKPIADLLVEEEKWMPGFVREETKETSLTDS